MEKSIRNSLSSKYQRFLKRGISGITASSRVLPNFIIIGTVRSGSTSLYYNLCEHPSIIPAAYDEIGFFDSNFHLGLNWYRSMFPTEKEMKRIKEKTKFAITGEDTPFYFWKKETVDRITKAIPNSKLIVIFRNPVDRAYSNYYLGIRAGTEKSTFEEAIDEEISFIKNHSFRECVDRKRSYLSKGFYGKQFEIWEKKFNEKKLHVISTEDMKKQPQETMSKVFKFLEIPEYNIKNPQKQKSVIYEKMNEDTRKRLLEFYGPHNEELFNKINQRFDWND